MLEQARAKGGNAVIGMRFDTSEMGDVWTELCAYGTAVVAVPVDEGAQQTATRLGYGLRPARTALSRRTPDPTARLPAARLTPTAAASGHERASRVRRPPQQYPTAVAALGYPP